jgi:hypothetical protein
MHRSRTYPKSILLQDFSQTSHQPSRSYTSGLDGGHRLSGSAPHRLTRLQSHQRALLTRRLSKITLTGVAPFSQYWGTRVYLSFNLARRLTLQSE